MKNLIYLFCLLFLGVSYAQDTTSTRSNQSHSKDLQQSHSGDYDLKEQTSYIFDNQEFYFTPDDRGIIISQIMDGNETPFGTLRRTTDDGFYILTSDVNSDVSFGRFDKEGNFMSYRYDSDLDKVIEQDYSINPVKTHGNPNNISNRRNNNN